MFRSRDVLAWGLHLSAGEEAAVTSDQEAHHSCFPDLISAARAMSPLGSQFSFLLIGALIRSGGGGKHIVFAHLKAWHRQSVPPASVAVFLHVKGWGIRRGEERKEKKNHNCILEGVFARGMEVKRPDLSSIHSYRWQRKILDPQQSVLFGFRHQFWQLTEWPWRERLSGMVRDGNWGIFSGSA